jgi:hypothetical protein
MSAVIIAHFSGQALDIAQHLKRAALSSGTRSKLQSLSIHVI